MRKNYIMPDGYNQKYIKEKDVKWCSLSYYSSITLENRKLNVLLPYGYNDEKEYPVLYLLHGIGGDENEWKDAGPEYIISNLLAEHKIKEFITVLPNVRTRADDKSNPDDIFTLGHFKAFDMFREELGENIMPFIAKSFKIRKGRENAAIAGLSMGGRESLYIGFTKPWNFGYIGAFSPAYGIFPYTNNGVTEKGLFKKEEFQLPDKYKDNTFVMITNGDNDMVTKGQAYEYHNVLMKNNTKHLYKTYTGGHDFSVWSNSLYEFVQHIFNLYS